MKDSDRLHFRALIVAALGVLFLALWPTAGFARSDVETVKGRLIAGLLASAPSQAAVEKLLQTMREDGTWPGIDYRDVSRTGFAHRHHTENLVVLARAWRNPKSKGYHSREIKNAVEKALGYWVKNDFVSENWWYNQIGTPQQLVSVMLLMGEALPAELVEKAQPAIARAHLNASGARPSGDRIKIAGILAKNLLFLDRQDAFGEVIKVIEGEIRFVTGPGLQHDYSFHHRTDGVNNTLSYGISYAEAFAEWAAYVAGTRFAFSKEKLEPLIDYYLDGICKHLAFGRFPDPGARNRSIARPGSLRPFGSSMAERLVITTDYRKAELGQSIKAQRGQLVGALPHSTFFWRSDHFTFQRPGFFTSVRMYSNRNHNMEVPYNSEGLFNHHRGDGANHVLLTGDEYQELWPVYDWQKIPGATVMQKPALPAESAIHKRGLTEFVGAVTDGRYGAAAFDFKSPHDPLEARKAWFFFDDVFVCLGAGIQCRGELPVVTTVNQCLLDGPVVAMDGLRRLVLKEGEHPLKNVRWILHDGVGYVFPGQDGVMLSNQTQSGSWYSINRQSSSSKKEIRLPVFKLWIQHGARPQNAGYQYVVVPGTTANELERGMKTRPLEMLANTPHLQAVRHAGLNLGQAVFYRPGSIRMADRMTVTCDSQGMVMLKTEAGRVRSITVADPSRKLQEIKLTISARLQGAGASYRAAWNDEKQASEIVIQLPQGAYAGQSVTIRF